MPGTVWKGFLSFGLVSVPVRLYAAARSKSVHFNSLYRRKLPRAATEFDGPEITESGGEPELPDNVLPISQGASPHISRSPAASATQLSRVTQEFHAAGEETAIKHA